MEGKIEKSQTANVDERIHDMEMVQDKSQETNEKENNTHIAQQTQQELHIEPTSQEDVVLASSVEMKRKKKKALLEFRCRVEDSILGNYLLGKPCKNLSTKEKSKLRDQLKEITLWGVPLLPSKCHEGTDILLLKFLKAKDFKVHEAFEMLRKTLEWRKEYNTDSILEEDLDPDIEKVMFMDTQDRQGHPLYYNIYGALKDKKLYKKLFGTEEKCERFLRLRVQFMELGIKKLNFKAGGPDSIVQITDLKNSPGPGMKELRSISKKALIVLQDNYPELIHKNILINVPFWYYASHTLTSRLITQRANSKFVFARPSKVTKTLLKYISPENLPVEYGGLKRENDEDFFPEDKASELIIRKSSAGCIQIPVTEVGITMVWDVTLVGWDVSYKEVFVPDDEGSYTVHFQNDKEKKMGESIRNSFYINEPGKIVVTIDNASFKKKRVFYRYKAKPTLPMYIFIKE
ncbi:Sec14p-like phosphatidylinositol transfer family protein putative isoform 1 [Tripterygium wilfordii]|uniref:Sec14p-like phosphatidylinositol transfer family protein putative isoform 1 n=1 Tax=Tripterygium wilfordii TaxID=458696 RepID=A0A7J7CXZ6_TRIWF|nr:patellin-4-like [Tripterygium wilfordii]KAF5738944.1 Sec14p-like phosphatidylinositol transfer family protein putative isoform 1 [Tripterygium wilfordii]